MISIRLLGELEVRKDGAPVALPPSRKTRALLAYLALAERPVRREHLCELLWDVPDDPRGALRWSLSKLRGLVDEAGAPPALVADRQTVFLDPARVDVDLRRVQAACAAGTDATPVADLEAAAAAFRDAMLADLDLPHCPGFQSWLIAEREAARALETDILVALIARHADDPEAALVHARARVKANSDDETAWADLVALLGATGRRREAEEQAAAGRRLLESVGPLSGALARAAAQAASAPAPVAAEPEIQPIQRRPVAQLRQEIRFCQAGDGTRVAYATVGDGPPLVKTANWMNHLEYDWESPVWGHFFRRLGHRHRLFRYDARGNGLSDWDVGKELNVDAWVSDLEAVVEASGLDRFPLLGVSQGCSISIAYAVRHPERVTKLVLYAGYAAGVYARSNEAEHEQRRAMTVLIRHGWGLANPAFRQMFTSRFIPDATREQADSFNELQRMTAPPECAARYYEATGHIDVRDLLSQVRAPTLVLHPVDDANIPIELGRRMAAGIPGAQFVALPGQNHLFLEHEPAAARFFEELDRFLAD